MGRLAGGREGDREAFLFLLTGVWKPLSVIFMVAISISDNYKLEIIR